MITTKQRAFLRGLANVIDPTVQIGKEGLTENALLGIGALLEAREIIKIKVLKNAEKAPKEIAVEIINKLNAEPVQVIGGMIVIYRKSSKKGIKHIELP